ncbi:hypothetical protein D9M73_193240 [compost metagenome]
MFLGVDHGVPGQVNVLVELAQGIVADVHGLVDLVRIRLQAGLVAAAAEQVVAELDTGLPVVVVVTDLACGVVVGTGGQHRIQARIER